jgi:Xaa-Pro aminopeptidase
VRPGAADVNKKVADFFHAEGFPTEAHNDSPIPLKEGYFHSIGHGVGLEVHERPWMGLRSEPLVEGDVVAIEPGLYFKGMGGVRLEDTVLVTEEGHEHFTDPLSYDLEP